MGTYLIFSSTIKPKLTYNNYQIIYLSLINPYIFSYIRPFNYLSQKYNIFELLFRFKVITTKINPKMSTLIKIPNLPDDEPLSKVRNDRRN
jgi:hypothetical protein